MNERVIPYIQKIAINLPLREEQIKTEMFTCVDENNRKRLQKSQKS